ncbi:MAG: fluoride efflux transporter FluC [Rhodoluna sp.]
MEALIVPVLVTLAGGIGAVLRFYMAQWQAKLPLGILAANTVASFVLGIFFGNSNPGMVVIVSAFAGGLSTFSSFSAQTSQFLTVGLRLRAVFNLILNFVIPLIAVWLGTLVGALVN